MSVCSSTAHSGPLVALLCGPAFSDISREAHFVDVPATDNSARYREVKRRPGTMRTSARSDQNVSSATVSREPGDRDSSRKCSASDAV
jgi:hypothetical protein